MKMYPGIKRIFKSGTRLDPDDFLATFEFEFETGHCCEKLKFCDSHAKRELKKYHISKT